MNLVFVSSMTGHAWGGSEELWSQSALRLKRAGHRVSASIESCLQRSPRVAQLAEEGIDVMVRRPVEQSLIAKAYRKLAGHGREHESCLWIAGRRPDLVVISQGGYVDGLEWMQFCRDSRIPYSSVVQSNPDYTWPRDELAEQLAEAYSGARDVYCVSQQNLDTLQRQIGKTLDHAHVVKNPYCARPDAPLPWPSTTPLLKLACVARLEPAAKGQDLLLCALSRPQWRQRPVEINLYGRGPCEQGLRALACRLDLANVVFRGHVPNITSIWERNHLLVLSSRYEGTPLALAEAMWCGRPAVVTDVGGNCELCQDGLTGFVAPAPTVNLVGDALERAWSERGQWQAMGQAARRCAERSISSDPVGDFCEELLGNASGATARDVDVEAYA